MYKVELRLTSAKLPPEKPGVGRTGKVYPDHEGVSEKKPLMNWR